MKKEMFDTIDERILRSFEIVRKMGKGAYGQVWKARDKKTSSVCALKKIYDAFRNATDAQRVYREIKYLQKLSHPNIIKIISYYRPESSRDIYIALEFMEADLSTAIRNGVLKELHKHFIFYQIANAVRYLHSAHLMHRDLKPSNILVNEDCEVKVCDFGLIRSLVPCEGDSRVVLTQNIATRWYRAPEILLCSNSYGKEIDVWSLGCVLAELFLCKPLFQGTSAISQLEKIFEVTGKPTWEQMSFIKSEASRAIVQSMTVTKKKSFSDLFPKEDKQLVDLLERIFQVDPRKRITIEDIIRHPFVNKFKGRVEKKRVSEPIKIPFQSKPLTVEEYRMLLFNEIEEKLTPLNTDKTSENSTYYDSSISQSLPNNSRAQFFSNNCPLGRPDRYSPQRNTNLPKPPCSPPNHKQISEISSEFKKKKEYSNVISPQKVLINGQSQAQSDTKKLEKSKKIFSFPLGYKKESMNKTVLPSPEKDKHPTYQQMIAKRPISPFKSPDEMYQRRNNSFESPSRIMIQPMHSKTPAQMHSNMFKVMQEMMQVVERNIKPKKASPCHNIKQEKSTDNLRFHLNKTLAIKQQFRRDKIVPKFILEGRKKFRSGSPPQLSQMKHHFVVSREKDRNMTTFVHEQSDKMRKHLTVNSSQQSLQFKNNSFASPNHRQYPKTHLLGSQVHR